MSDERSIVLETHGDIGWLTIERADNANALTIAMMAAMRASIAQTATDASIKALILTGAGQRAFSGGVDVRTPTDLPDEQARSARSERFFELIMALARFEKPLITAMNGIASGGGAMIALLADHIVAAQSAAIAFPEIDLGGPTLPGAAILMHRAGAGIAADLVQSARRMTSAEALARGLIHEIAAPADLRARAERAAFLLGSKPAPAFALNKEWIARPLLAALDAAHDEHRRLRQAGAMR